MLTVTPRSYQAAPVGKRAANDALYPSFNQVEQQLHDWAREHPDKASLHSLGKTYENRDIWALRIGQAAEGSKPGLLVTGTTHAREWNTLSTAMNVARSVCQTHLGWWYQASAHTFVGLIATRVVRPPG